MTDVFVARITASNALAAEVAVTRLAVTVAGLTQVVVALLARVAVFGVDRVAAVRAVHPLPIGERNVRAAAVVGQQYVVDDQKEVSDSSLF